MAHLCGGSKLKGESSIQERKSHAERAKNVHEGV
jgi:hypothetical protein